MTFGVTLAQGVTAIPGGGGAAYYVPPGTTDVSIQSAVGNVAARGGGTVYLGAGTYIINTPVTLVPNVNIIGVPTSFVPQTGLISNEWVPSGGTIIQAGTATQGFINNTTNLGTPTGWTAQLLANQYLSGVTLSELCFKGFTQGGIVIGAQNNPGATQCRFHRLFFFQCGSLGVTSQLGSGYPAFWSRNDSSNNFSQIYTCQCQHGLWSQNSVPGTTDLTGNCYFNDIQIDITSLGGTLANFSRPMILGTDPAITGGGCNEMKAFDIAIYAFTGRTTITDAAVTGAGTTAVSVAAVQNWPVGMPVMFTVGTFSGNVYKNSICFVLTNPGGTGAGNITVGDSRGGAALTLAAGTYTLIQQGFPLLDLGGSNTGTFAGLSNSILHGLDLEGPALGVIYGENIAQVNIIPLEFTSSTNSHICIRSSGSTSSSFVSVQCMNAFAVPDIDGGSAATMKWTGVRRQPISTKPGYANNGGAGVYYDQTSSLQGLNLGGAAAGSILPQFYVTGSAGNDFTYPNAGIGQRMNYTTSTGSLNSYQPGAYPGGAAGGITLTLPALANSTVSLSAVGNCYEFVNTFAGAMVIKGSSNVSGQWLNNNSGLTNNQVSLATGQFAIFRGAQTANGTTGGTTFWMCMTNGTIS